MPDASDTPLIDVAEAPVATRRAPWPLVVGTMLIAALWVLIHLASEVREGGVLGFDRSLMTAMRVPGQPGVPGGPRWLPSMMRDFTGLGGGPVLTVVVTLVSTFLILRRQWRPAVLIGVATISGGVAIALAKSFFARTRPDLVDHLVDVTSKSFPSGHAGNSAIVYLTLAAVMFPVIREARLRIFVLVAALLLVATIGASRVYLGVHWPSDVLAGWLFGALWALGWWYVEARLLPRRGPKS